MFPIIMRFSLRRVTRLILGMGLGITAGVVVYLISQREREEFGALGEREAAAPRLDVERAAPKTAAPQEVQSATLSPSLQADPVPFVRQRPGTISVETLPGATCSIEALYSTGRRPGSLDTGPVKADAKGKYQWTWEIGTSGTHVDVTVSAWLEGYEKTEAKLRVKITG